MLDGMNKPELEPGEQRASLTKGRTPAKTKSIQRRTSSTSKQDDEVHVTNRQIPTRFSSTGRLEVNINKDIKLLTLLREKTRLL